MSQRPLATYALLAVVCCASSTASAQIVVGDDPFEGSSRYESIYGPPVDVSLWDLAQNPESYDERVVRTKGRIDIDFGTGRSGERSYVLREAAGSAAVIAAPVQELRAWMETEVNRLLGQPVNVTGLFRASRGEAGGVGRVAGSLTFWSLLGPPEKGQKLEAPKEIVSLEALVANPGRHDGRRVRVIGQFRGGNLYGDLPARSKLVSGDWVLKDDVFAIWITGRKPKGSGFDLDADLKRDTGKWLDVSGRVSTRAGITYIQADNVALTTAPSASAGAAAPPPPPERPKQPPVIVFSLPLDGELDISDSERFTVQFSKDMDEDSFRGRVLLRYAGPVRPGDRPFDAARLSYDGGRRALTVDPGDRLRPGRVIELILLEGIADLEGLTLTARPGRVFQGAVDVLRWSSARNLAGGS
jgi:hypothetical protein